MNIHTHLVSTVLTSCRPAGYLRFVTETSTVDFWTRTYNDVVCRIQLNSTDYIFRTLSCRQRLCSVEYSLVNTVSCVYTNENGQHTFKFFPARIISPICSINSSSLQQVCVLRKLWALPQQWCVTDLEPKRWVDLSFTLKIKYDGKVQNLSR